MRPSAPKVTLKSWIEVATVLIALGAWGISSLSYFHPRCTPSQSNSCKCDPTGNAIEGQQQCVDGEWSPCECPQCIAGQKKTCTCTGTGTGTGRSGHATCGKGKWSSCECEECKPEAPVPCRCSYAQFDSRRECQAGALGDCLCPLDWLAGNTWNVTAVDGRPPKKASSMTFGENGSLSVLIGNDTVSGKWRPDRNGIEISSPTYESFEVTRRGVNEAFLRLISTPDPTPKHRTYQLSRRPP